MADSQRLPVNYLVLHHAVTPLWQEKSRPELAKWFSDNGFKRGYSSNPSLWSGLINPYNGERSYSQAHFAGQQVTTATPDATKEELAAGYRLVPLVNDVWGQICWHAGNWEINRKSIGIENLGDYRSYTLRDGDCAVLADFWRKQDRAFNGNTFIVGHKEVSQTGTECPARIMEQRDHIVELVNSDPPPPESWSVVAELNPPLHFYSQQGVQLYNIDTGVPVGDLNKGDIYVAGKTNIFHGSTWYLTRYSIDHNAHNGFKEEDLPWPAIEPEPPTTTTTTTTTSTTTTTTVDPAPPSDIVKFFTALYNWLKDWFSKS